MAQTHIMSPRLIDWLKRQRQHRSDKNGTEILCPVPDKIGFRAEGLHQPAHRVRKCPLCGSHLMHPDRLPEKGEVLWRIDAAAA